MLLAGEDGTVWDGTMDLIAGAPERPEVVDYKTDAGEDLEKIYEGQLAVYAECLRRAAGLRVTPPARTEKLARRGN
jgi:ATP-dependent exoDNAse (exonuclease V) beta subunit